MKSIFKRPLIVLPIASLLLAFGVAASGETADALLRRYPYDPACPWGRIGNGKGLIVRCLSELETQTLRAGTLPVASPAAAGTSIAPPPSPAPTTPAPSEEPNDADAGPPSPN